MSEVLFEAESQSPSAMGVWALVDTSYTCVFPADDEPDPVLVKEIRAFDPKFVPVLHWREYRLPTGSKVRQAYHYIARHVTDCYDPEEDLGEPLRIEAFPSNFPFVGGAIYGQMTWCLEYPKGSLGHRDCLPPMPLPFDRELVEFLRATHHAIMRTPGTLKSKVMEAIGRDRDRQQRMLEKVEAEARLRLRDDRRQIRDCISNGRWGPPPGPRPTRPSVHIRITTAPESEAP